MGKTKTSKPKRQKSKNGKVETVQIGSSTFTIEILDLQEAADFLRVSKKALEEDAKKGVVPGKFVAGEWRFLKQALYNWLNCAFSLTVSDVKEPDLSQRIVKSIPGETSTPNARQLSAIGMMADDDTLQAMTDAIYRRRVSEE